MNGLKAISNFTYQIGIELEFYLTKNQQQIVDQKLVEDFIAKLDLKIRKSGIDLLKIEPEQGLGQIEIKTKPEKDLEKLIFDLEKVKVITKELAIQISLEADFSPTPFYDDCSSALQINLTVLDKNNQNLFAKNNENESTILLNSIAALLKLTPENLHFFTNLKGQNLRFDLVRNQKLFLKGKYPAPVNLSWGYDNRSCAIRVVGKAENRRLEYRIPDADINVKKALIKFLEIVNYGTMQNLKVPLQILGPIYGNAFDQKYQELLPLS